MSECNINSRKLKNDISSLLEKDLLKSGFFTKVGEDLISKVQPVDAQDFARDVNNKFSTEVLKRVDDNHYRIAIPDSLVERYFIETKDGKDTIKIFNLNNTIVLDDNSWDRDEMFHYLNYGKVSEITNEKLKSFLSSIGFRVEEIDNLSLNGVTYIKDFLVQVKTLSKLSVMPEEVAHAFIKMLPDTHPLKVDMMKNITSYPIYSLTLQQYKNEYLTSEGTPDYNKIKEEAAGKLVAEFVKAIAEEDYTRVEQLGKQRENFLKRWLNNFLKFLGLGMLRNTSSYKDIAGIILSGKNDLPLRKDVEDLSFTDSYFYNMSEIEIYDDAYEIITHVPDSNKLLEIMSRANKEFSRLFLSILKEDKFEELNNELQRGDLGTNKLNKLSEIKLLFATSGIDMADAANADRYMKGVKEFLEAINKLDLLSKGILNVINDKDKAKSFDEAIGNIRELEGYFSVYKTFMNIISGDFVRTLAENKVGTDVVDRILQIKSKFDTVNNYILTKERQNLVVIWHEMLADTNSNVAKTLQERLDRAIKTKDQDLIKKVKADMDKFIITDENIMDMLSGRGGDIDNFSNLNHLINAAILNGDQYVSSITKYIQNFRNKANIKALEDQQDLYAKIDKLQKSLNEPSHTTGETISFIDEIFDGTTKKGRAVRKWLNPHKGIEMARDTFKNDVNVAREAYLKIDKNDKPAIEAGLALLKSKQKAYNDFLQKYYNRPYLKSYYDFREKYEDDSVFIDAMAEYSNFTLRISGLEEAMIVEPENTTYWEELALLKRDRVNLLNETDTLGNQKVESELKKVAILKKYFEESQHYKELDLIQSELSFKNYRSRYEQQVDFALQDISKSNPKTIEAVETKLRELLKEKRLRIATLYNEYGDENIDYKLVKDILMEKWDSRNIVIQKNDAYYEYEKGILDEIKELKGSGTLTPEEERLADKYTELRNLRFGSRDNIGQIDPSSFTEEEIQKINEIEEEIEELKTLRPPLSVDVSIMTDEDRDLWNTLIEKIADPNVVKNDRMRAIKAKSKLSNKYKNKGKAKEIGDLYGLLGSIQEVGATEYYWDKMSDFIEPISEYVRETLDLFDTEEEKLAIRKFEKDFVSMIDNRYTEDLDFDFYTLDEFQIFLAWLKTNKPQLARWFNDNHKEKSKYDAFKKTYVKLPFVRSSIYSHSEPILEEHQKIVYNKKHQKYRVKDEYRTGYNPETREVDLKVGVHITNRESLNGFAEFLPLSPEQGEPIDSPYRNEEYYKLKNSKDPKDKTRFEYLETLKNEHLRQQEKLPPNERSWMQVPVMNLSSIESIKNIPNWAKQNLELVKSVFKKSEEGDALAQIEGIDTIRDIDYTTQTIIEDRIPKIGMSQRIPIETVSTDLVKSVAQFILRAHEFEAKSEAAPVVKAINRVMSDNAFIGEKSGQKRAQIFEKIYSQMILDEVPESTLNNRTVRRISKFLTGNTALRMLADPIGGIINYGSAMVNNMIEATAGQYISLAQLGRGKLLSVDINTSLMADFNKKTNFSYNTLLFNYFDFIQGDFEEDMLDRSSSLDKKSSIRQLLMLPRKSGELMAQTAVAMGILERHKVPNSIDGKEYPMHQIYEKVGEKLRLKKGFPEKYNPVDGKEFFRIRGLIHHVNLQLHGNYAKMNQTEVSRHALGKLAENMKRWFMPAFQRRFGRETPDIMFEDLTEGYYRTSAVALYNYFGALLHLNFGRSKSISDFYLKDEVYKRNLQRMGAEMAQAFILWLVFAVMLGYSGDDKNKKLDSNSWIHNTAILVALRVYSETNAYIPIPQVGPFGGGFQEMKRNILSPFSLPADAVSNMAAMAQLGLYQVLYMFGADTLKSDLYYSKDSGFWFSDKGDSKLMKYVLKTAGYTGYTFEPAPYIKNFNNLQNRLK